MEDIADFLLFCMQYGTMDWIEYDMDNSIVTWLLTTVCAPQCIKNPYVLAKLVEVLFVTPQNQNLHNMVMFHPIAQSVLVSSLMKFYVDIETTGNVSDSKSGRVNALLIAPLSSFRRAPNSTTSLRSATTSVTCSRICGRTRCNVRA